MAVAWTSVGSGVLTYLMHLIQQLHHLQILLTHLHVHNTLIVNIKVKMVCMQEINMHLERLLLTMHMVSSNTSMHAPCLHRHNALCLHACTCVVPAWARVYVHTQAKQCKSGISV